MQQLTICFGKSHLCACVRVSSMCSKLEGILKHIGLTAWTHAWCAMAFSFQKNKKLSEEHETLVDVISCHQDDVVKKLACLTKVWTHSLTNRSNSLEGSWF